jgi:tRNA (guanosine-2'-O-)-methyltransferase
VSAAHDLIARDPAAACAALAPLLLPERRARIDEAIAQRLGGLRVAIENLHDPHNGAAVLRSAEAFGVQRVDVIETVEPFRFSPTVSQGCEKWLDIVRHKTHAAAVAALRADGFVIYAAVPGAPVTVEDLDFTRRAAILVGNEHDGLSQSAIDDADVRFAIPMPGMTRSLNLSVAAALVTERAAALRRAALRKSDAGAGGGDLDEATQLLLRARFYAASVRGADAVLARHAAGARR